MGKVFRAADLVNLSSRSLGVGRYIYLGGDDVGLFQNVLKDLKKARKEGNVDVLLEMRNEILSLPAAARKAFPEDRLNPKKPQDRIVFSITDLRSELVWSMGFIYANIEKLKTYTLYKNNIYQAYYNGDLRYALELIEEFNSTVGYSYSILDIRMTVLQTLDGLDSQKAYRNHVIQEFGPLNYAWVTSLFSERSEDRVTFENFRFKMDKSSNRWRLPDVYKKFYKHLTTKGVSISREEYSLLININSRVSLYDHYEIICEAYDIFPEDFLDQDRVMLEEIRKSDFEYFTEYKIVLENTNNMIDNLNLNNAADRSILAKQLLFNRYLPEFTKLWLSFREITTDKFDEWVELSEIVSDRKFKNSHSLQERRDVFNLIKENNYLSAASKIVSLVNKDSENLFILPIEISAQHFIDKEEDYREFSERSSMIDIYMRINQESSLKDRAFWYFEDFLDDHEVDRPTNLPDDVFNNKEILQYFLRYTANYANLSLLDALPKTRDVDNEKVAILIRLIEMDSINADSYKDQLSSILTRMSIQDGMKIVDQSRIYVDTKSITKSAKINYDHSFLRYRNLIQSSNIFLLNFENVKRALDSKTNAELFRYLDIPQDEASALIALIVDELKEQYLFDPEYGLNAFLSMRVRHGTLPGTLRGAAQEAKVLVIKDRNGEFIDSTYWLGYENDKHRNIVKQTLINITVGFEKVLHEKLQPLFYVESEQNKSGKLSIPLLPEDLGEIHGHVKAIPDISFEKFTEVVFAIFRNKLTQSLKSIITIIDEDIRPDLNNLFIKAHEDIKDINSDNIEELRLTLTNVRFETDKSLDLIKSWLSVTDSEATDTVFSIGQMLDIGIQMSKKLTRGFNPTIHLPDELEDKVDVSLVKEITDIIVIVIDNASKYSGKNDANVYIDIKNDNKGINFKFRTEMAYNPTEDQIRNLNEINELIASGEYRNKLQTEGKSGLIKIKRIISSHLRNFYKFYYTNTPEFVVEFYISVNYERSNKNENPAD